MKCFLTTFQKEKLSENVVLRIVTHLMKKKLYRNMWERTESVLSCDLQ